MDNVEYDECCGRKMSLIGVTEEGNYRYSCGKCHTIIEIDEQLEDVQIVHKGVKKA